MPIQCAMRMMACSESEFYRIDEILTGLAFEIHNELGRFLDDEVSPHTARPCFTCWVHEQPVTLFAGHREIGIHRFHLLDAQTAVVVTAITKDHRLMRKHLMRLIAPTHLRFMQWINFNRHTVELTTLSHHS